MSVIRGSATGESVSTHLRVNFDRRLKPQFHGAKLSSDGGMIKIGAKAIRHHLVMGVSPQTPSYAQIRGHSAKSHSNCDKSVEDRPDAAPNRKRFEKGSGPCQSPAAKKPIWGILVKNSYQ